MAVTPRIFISATSGDLKSHRATVAEALKKLETYAEVQDDWPPDYRTVEQMLRRRLKDCDAVIHLVGLRYGAEPRALPPGVPRRSYTQMEYHIARELKKPVYLFLLPDTFPYDDGAPAEDDEKRALQQAHRAQVMADSHLHYSPPDAARLNEAVLSLQPLVDKLRAALRRQRLYLTGGIAALLAISGSIAYAVMREKDVNIEQAKAISELQKPETAEVKFFKEIQLLRSQTPMVATAQAGGGSSSSGQMSYADALASVAKDHGLTADSLRGMLDNFATRVLADPNADTYERAIAEFHRKNYAAAITLATTAAETADKELKEKRQKSIEAWTLVGDSEFEQVHYQEALAAYQKALKSGDKEDDPKQWSNLAMNVAILHYTQAGYQAAEPIFEEILVLREQEFGKNAPETATALNFVAQLLRATNRLAEAEPLMRRTLLIDEASFGKFHFNVGRDLNNLALLLQAMNRLAEAEPLMRRALAIAEAPHLKDAAQLALFRSNLAMLLKEMNRLEEAEPLLRRALLIDETAFGKDHPRVGRDLNNLAQLLHDMNHLAEAEPLMRRALAINETAYGKHHPLVATVLNNLAALLQAANRLIEAEPLLRRALAIDEAVYGEVHPKIATCLNNLAMLLKDTDRLAETEPLLRRSLAIAEAAYGRNHPNVGIHLNNFAKMLSALNRPAEAVPVMRRMVGIFVDFTVKSGHPHPNLEAATDNYRELLLKMGDTEEQAREKVRKILTPEGVTSEALEKIREEVLGK